MLTKKPCRGSFTYKTLVVVIYMKDIKRLPLLLVLILCFIKGMAQQDSLSVSDSRGVEVSNISGEKQWGDLGVSVSGFDVKNRSVDHFKVLYKNTEVVLDYPVERQEQAYLDFYIPLQLHFIEQVLGRLPTKILVTEKIRRENRFIGIDDFTFWKFRLQLFQEAEKIDLNYFSILSQLCVEETLHLSNTVAPWVKNGLQTYIEIQYLNKNYPEKLLLGELPERLSLFNIKPLKWTNLSKTKLLDRYALGYKYMMRQNLDQPLATPWAEFSRFNQQVISHMEAGLLFNYFAKQVGETSFNKFIKHLVALSQAEDLSEERILGLLGHYTNGASAFLPMLVQRKNRVNFKLKDFQKLPSGEVQVRIKKNTPWQIPVQIKAIDSLGREQIYWYQTSISKDSLYTLPTQNRIEKLVLNDGYLFPEVSSHDNYLYTQGFFSNMKKPKLKLYTDVPNAEYNEIYLRPSIRYNYYDKVLVGLGITNAHLIPQPLVYTLKPYFSTGSRQLTGMAGVSYTIYPVHPLVQSWRFGGAYHYFHYAKSLGYRKLALYTHVNFNKNPIRQGVSQLRVAYEYVDKALSAQMKASGDYHKYNLWNIGYTYTDKNSIYEKMLGVNVQHSEDFNKIFLESTYQWMYQKNQSLKLRFFGGYFITNTTRNTYFDFGISTLSNYSFSRSIIRRSKDAYYAPRQFILAEGGFKSAINNTANHWLSTLNLDFQFMRYLGVYADMGLYKNRHTKSQFVWDSGVGLKIIPNLFEIYFPIQSTLGFEPSMPAYNRRIRFMFNFDFSALLSRFK